MTKTSLSVLVPVYNEQHLVYTSLQRLKVLEESAHLERIEVIVVDDCSTDDSPQVLRRFAQEQTGGASRIEWIFLTHAQNGGKGRAIQTALERATCDISVIHDADLEYHPKDLLRIVKVFTEEGADAVYGSRFAGGEVRRVLLYRHELGNKFLTALSNLVTNLNLSDMETCYKAIRTPLFKSIPIESNDFRIEPELTIKLAKRDARIFEIPISYSGRTYQEGKKINWRDGFRALTAIIKFAVSNNIRRPDHERAHALEFLRAPRLDAWVADVIRGFCGSRVLEIGSGTGAMTLRLVPRTQYVASDIDPLNLQVLEALSSDRPYMRSSYCKVTDLASFPRVPTGYDTVLCLNVLEHLDTDDTALANLCSVLVDGGIAIVQVPHGQWNYSGLDRFLGRRRRYSKKSLRQLAEDAGLTVREVFDFNRIGTVAWFLSGKMLRRRSFDHLPMWLFDRFTPFFRAIDVVWPFPGLSLIAVLERRDGVGQSSRVSSGSDYAAASLISAGVANTD